MSTEDTRVGSPPPPPAPAGTGTPDPARDAPAGQPGAAAGPRRVRLSVARVDPWSVMKLSFLLSVAIGIMTVIATALVWIVLDRMQVFAKVQDLFSQIGGSLPALMDYVAFDKVMSMATIVSVVDVVLLTALSTLIAFLYNITAALVGGFHLTLTDD